MAAELYMPKLPPTQLQSFQTEAEKRAGEMEGQSPSGGAITSTGSSCPGEKKKRGGAAVAQAKGESKANPVVG